MAKSYLPEEMQGLLLGMHTSSAAVLHKPLFIASSPSMVQCSQVPLLLLDLVPQQLRAAAEHIPNAHIMAFSPCDRIQSSGCSQYYPVLHHSHLSKTVKCSLVITANSLVKKERTTGCPFGRCRLQDHHCVIMKKSHFNSNGS